MKTLLKLSIILPFVLASMTSCQKEVTNTPQELTKEVKIIAQGEDTKTYIDGTTVKWAAEGEELSVLYHPTGATASLKRTKTTSYTLAGNIAEFSATFTPTPAATHYKTRAIAPNKNIGAAGNDDPDRLLKMPIPLYQYPGDDTYDPQADLLVSDMIETEGLPSSLLLTFRRHATFLRIVVKGIPTDEVISYVQLESSENIIGTIDIPTVNNGDPIPNATGNIVNAYINKQSTGNNIVWFGLIPTDLSGKTLTIRAYTDKATYEKTLTNLPANFSLLRASVNRMNLTYGAEHKNINQKTITFDFNSKPGEDWPIADYHATPLTCTYPHNGNNYSFILADATNASSTTGGRVYYDESLSTLMMAAQYRYLGLPIITDYNLTRLSFIQGAPRITAGRVAAVSSNIVASTTVPDGNPTFVEGGGRLNVNFEKETFEFNLTGTSADAQYYLYCAKTSGSTGLRVNYLTLTYTKP